MNNFFISYDLVSPGQKYDAVTDAIKSLGNWARVHLSLFYVSTNISADDALNKIKAAADSNDKIIVITASNATWTTLPTEISEYIQKNWNR